MPIYDNDGAASCEISKLYDNDGTANYQIGKVYDNDGTTNSLIYTAEISLFAGVSAQTAVASGAYVTRTQYSAAVNVSLAGCTAINITGTAATVVTGTGEYGTYGGRVYLSVNTNGTWNNEYALLATTSSSNGRGEYPVSINTSVDISSIALSITAVRLYLWIRTQNSTNACDAYVKVTNMAATAT